MCWHLRFEFPKCVRPQKVLQGRRDVKARDLFSGARRWHQERHQPVLKTGQQSFIGQIWQCEIGAGEPGGTLQQVLSLGGFWDAEHAYAVDWFMTAMLEEKEDQKRVKLKIGANDFSMTEDMRALIGEKNRAVAAQSFTSLPACAEPEGFYIDAMDRSGIYG